MLLKDKHKIRVGFSIGDLNGIGPEVLLKSLAKKELQETIVPILYAPYSTICFLKSHFDLKIDLNKIENVEGAVDNTINVLDVFNDKPKINFGNLDKDIGKIAFLSIQSSVSDLHLDKIDVLVTPPINKEAIHSDEFRFMGHTDYIDSIIGGSSTMMMVSKELRVALLSEHIPLSKVLENLSHEKIELKLNNLNRTLITDFNIEEPKIALLSIDPHAGDNGVISNSDNEILKPVIERLINLGVSVNGPFPSDSFFGTQQYRNFDLVVACYHDQGLIPFKTLTFNTGVNYTSGLDKIRTSPDHGTAYGIAGRGIANEESFLSAIYLAVEIYVNRLNYNKK